MAGCPPPTKNIAVSENMAVGGGVCLVYNIDDKEQLGGTQARKGLQERMLLPRPVH